VAPPSTACVTVRPARKKSDCLLWAVASWSTLRPGRVSGLQVRWAGSPGPRTEFLQELEVKANPRPLADRLLRAFGSNEKMPSSWPPKPKAAKPPETIPPELKEHVEANWEQTLQSIDDFGEQR
jgi:hypothetical protein